MAGKLLNEQQCVLILKRRVHRLTCAYSCQNATLFEISCRSSYLTFVKTEEMTGDSWSTVLRILQESVIVTKEIKLIKIEKRYYKRRKFNKNKNNSLFNSYNNKCRVQDSN